MKAAVVESPGVLVVREVPEPVMGPYDALCDILFCATCTATDGHLIAGNFPFGMEYPTILGHESIGRVTQLGAKVRNFRPGDLVTRAGATPHPEVGLQTGWGGFAQRGIVRDYRAMEADGVANDGWVFWRMNQVLPAGFDPADSTLIINWRETFSNITRLGVGYNSRVLVVGTGGVGLSFVNHAAILLAREIVVVGSPGRFELARKLGAAGVYDYRTEDLAEAIRADYAEGFDFIIDAVGKQGQLDRVLPLVKPGGAVESYGVDDYFSVTIAPHLAPGPFTFFDGSYAEEESSDMVLRLVQEGQLVAKNFYDPQRVYPLEEITEAFAAVNRREMVKAVVSLQD
ncbi:MAG TPA: zinc-binding dehydrogenase [Armatimonadota bacterium]|jgi:L-iditol 2-dehydrogenase